MRSDDDGGGDGELRWPRRNAIIGLLLAAGVLLVLGGALTAALAGFGHRWGWWHFTTGFSVLRWGVYASIAGVGASTVALVSAALLKRRWLPLAALSAIALGAAVISVPLDHRQRATGVPPIHDISTDLDDPPAFIALRLAREAAPNRVEHPGEAAARLQRDAYPAVVPMRLTAEPEMVFTAAEELARDLGWRIVKADPVEGRIEAVARTFWFGFRDDVVIRITETEDGRTRVDVRSASRVGRSDLGANARRIRDFLTRLQDRV
jgi:uncharacterized protein (DUF1499 family)